MRICCRSFLLANVMLSQAFVCLGHVTRQRTSSTSISHFTRRTHSSSFESPTPTPTTQYRHHKHGHGKTKTRCTARTMHPTLTTSSTRHHYTTLHHLTTTTTVLWSHATPTYKRPIHSSKHKKSAVRSKTTPTVPLATATPTIELHPIPLAQLSVNVFSPTASDSHHLSTPAGSDPNDNNIAPQSLATNGPMLTSFGSGVGVGVGCMMAIGMAGFLVYYQRRRQRRRQQLNDTNHGVSLLDSNHERQGTRWRPSSLMGVVTSMVEKWPLLPPRSSSLHQVSNTNIAGIAIGSGHGAVELTRHYYSSLDHDSIYSPPPFVRIPPHQY